jgi:hypothetical protein
MRRRIAWLAGTIVCSAALTVPAMAQAESLTISFATPTLGKPLTVTAAGVADGAHLLFAYADASASACASDPSAEYSRSRVFALSSASGDSLSAGNFIREYIFTWVEPVRICAYLDDTPSDVPDASATLRASGNPVEESSEGPQQEQPTGSWFGPQVDATPPPPVATLIGMKEYCERLKGVPEREGAGCEAQKTPKSVAPTCVVPSLKGDSLSRVRRALRAAHCELGTVRRRHGAHGALVVTAQAPVHGRKLAQGAPVAVTLARRKG